MKNLNLNIGFLLDLWADLKAKRLAPVAVGLLVALVAMPALMLRGGGEAEEGQLPVLAAASAHSSEVEVDEQLADRGSKLDSYRARDPFKSGRRPRADSAAGQSGTAIAPPGPGAGGGDKAPAVPGLDLGTAAGGTSGSTPPAGGGNGGSGAAPAPSGGEPRVVVKRPKHRYAYQLDVKFGRAGAEQRYRGVSRMSFLPRETAPVLLFVGVPQDEKSAIFIVQRGITHQGEGRCLPRPDRCHFLELRVGQEHYLNAASREYRVKLLRIKRVRLGGAGTSSKPRKVLGSRRSSRPGGEAASPTQDESAEDALPPLVDGIG